MLWSPGSRCQGGGVTWEVGVTWGTQLVVCCTGVETTLSHLTTLCPFSGFHTQPSYKTNTKDSRSAVSIRWPPPPVWLHTSLFSHLNSGDSNWLGVRGWSSPLFYYNNTLSGVFASWMRRQRPSRNKKVLSQFFKCPPLVFVQPSAKAEPLHPSSAGQACVFHLLCWLWLTALSQQTTPPPIWQLWIPTSSFLSFCVAFDPSHLPPAMSCLAATTKLHPGVVAHWPPNISCVYSVYSL